MLTQAELKQLLIYDPVTGVFINRVTRNSQALIGNEAGTNHPDGYRHMKINHKCYLAHRLAWLYVHGEWPDGQIDHINGNRKDNRIENLRLVCNKQNSENPGDNELPSHGSLWQVHEERYGAADCDHDRGCSRGLLGVEAHQDKRRHHELAAVPSDEAYE